MRLRYKVLGALMTVGVVLAVVIAPAIRGPAQAAARPGEQRMVRPTVPRTPSVKTLRGSKRGNTRTFRLTASQFKQRIANFPIKTATVWGYNNSTPGPTLLAYRGERIRVVIDNRLPEPTTVHFRVSGRLSGSGAT